MNTIPPKRAFKNISLFTEEDSSPSQNPLKVSLSKITLPQTQPRRYFNSEAMEYLKASIEKEGILQPILVRPQGNVYELVAGERRYRAALSLNLSEVPVIIKHLSDQEAHLIALTENLQREDLNPLEETEGILSLLSLQLEKSEPEIISLLQHLDHLERGNIKVNSDSAHNVMGKEVIEEIFTRLGITWQSFLKNRVPLLNLPEDVLEKLRTGTIAYTKGKEISKLKNEEIRKSLLEEAIAQKLSLKQIKERIKNLIPRSEIKTNSPEVRTKNLWKRINKQKPWNWSDKQKQKKWIKLIQQLEDLFQED